MSTGERIAPKDWNTKTARPRATAPNAAILSDYLDRLATKVRETHLMLRSDMTVITPNALKAAILRDIRNQSGKETLIEYAERYSTMPQATGHR
jgi:hypothetical protein